MRIMPSTTLYIYMQIYTQCTSAVRENQKTYTTTHNSTKTQHTKPNQLEWTVYKYIINENYISAYRMCKNVHLSIIARNRLGYIVRVKSGWSFLECELCAECFIKIACAPVIGRESKCRRTFTHAVLCGNLFTRFFLLFEPICSLWITKIPTEQARTHNNSFAIWNRVQITIL